MDAIVAVGGSRAKRKASVLESDEGPSLLGVGRHWREQMAVEIGGVLKEVLNLDADQVAKARQIHAAHGGYPASPMGGEAGDVPHINF